MIKSVEITFDFGKLAKKMPEILKNYGSVGAKALAENARSMIRDGKLKNVTEGTMQIAEKKLSPKRPYPRQGTKQQALLHTGSALASIKAIDDEVHAAGYLKYHMEEYIIVRNKWTKKFTPFIIGKPVPERNPFFTPKGSFRKPVKDKMKAERQDMYNKIAKALKK